MSSPIKTAPYHRLGDVPLFAALPPHVLDNLARTSRTRRFGAGQVLWNEGDPGKALLVLEEGQLRVCRFTGAGTEVVLAVVEAPSALGELALLEERHATRLLSPNSRSRRAIPPVSVTPLP